jgi:hypothetical protein
MVATFVTTGPRRRTAVFPHVFSGLQGAAHADRPHRAAPAGLPAGALADQGCEVGMGPDEGGVDRLRRGLVINPLN